MQQATLCFVQRDEDILLIRKKRGIGDGLYNGPGGKVEEGESVREAAIREVEEEVGITPEGVEKRGELKFFLGGEPFHHVHVFVSDSFEGEPQETEEARPEWFSTEDIPFDEMWPDDRHWFPLMLEGERFEGTFHFDEDGEEILEYELDRKEQF